MKSTQQSWKAKFAVLAALSPLAMAQQAGSPPAAPTTTQEQEPPGGKRVLGVLPNYRTATAADEGKTITAKQKLNIARKDTFDYPLVVLAGALAGIDQLNGDNPSFGQGVKGYAHRLGTWYADEAIGNMFSEGIFPVLFHEDPRYFRRGSGSVMHRTGYAISRVFVTTTDSGKHRFNFSEWSGNAVSVAISQSYYPDNRTAGDATEKLLEQVGTDAISQVLKEFWPDIKKKFVHKK